MTKFKKKIIKSQRDLSQMPRPDKKDHHPCGDSLFIRVEPLKDERLSMSFVGKMRHPVTQTQKEVTIGRTKDIKLSDANTSWLNIKRTAKEQKCDPNKIGISNRNKTLGYVTDQWLTALKPKWEPYYYRDIRNKVYNTILPEPDAERCIRDYEVGISKKWVTNGCNPVGERNSDLMEDPDIKHYPRYKWEELPEFLERLDIYGRSCIPQELLALLLIIITGQRVGAISRLEWSWIDHENKIIEILGTTKGIKRRGKGKKIPHLLPLTPITEAILDRAKHYTASKKYVFTNAWSNKRYPHLDPEAPSRVMRKVSNTNNQGEQVTSHG